MTDIIAQALGIFAMGFNILSYQQKQKRAIIIMQFVGATLFSVSFFMLGAITGAMLNAAAIARALIYSMPDLKRGKQVCALFFGVFLLLYVLTFTALGMEPTLNNLLIELLPTIAMASTTVGFTATKAKTVRITGLISSPLWLIYNILCFSLGGIICEVFSLFSIVIGLLRFDLKLFKKDPASDQATQ